MTTLSKKNETKWYIPGEPMTMEQAIFYLNEKIKSANIGDGEKEIIRGLKAMLEQKPSEDVGELVEALDWMIRYWEDYVNIRKENIEKVFPLLGARVEALKQAKQILHQHKPAEVSEGKWGDNPLDNLVDAIDDVVMENLIEMEGETEEPVVIITAHGRQKIKELLQSQR